LNSRRTALLLQDTQREGAFARTHTSIGTITPSIRFLFLAGSDLCEFHTEQWAERCSVPVGCLPHTFLQSIGCRSAVHCLKSQRVALLSQDTRREGAFTFSLIPSVIAFVLSTIYNNLVTIKDYFSMLKSSVLMQCTEGLLIRVQPNT
jgi:hypothetical protein